MAKINSYMYCSNSQSKGQQQSLNNLLMVLSPISIPGNFSFVFTCGINCDPLKPCTIRIVFKDHNNKIIHDSGDVEINIVDFPDTYLPEEYRGIFASTDFRNLTISEPGIHKTEVYFDKECIGVFPIPVYQAKK